MSVPFTINIWRYNSFFHFFLVEIINCISIKR